MMIARKLSALWQALEADLGRDELDAAAIVFLGDYCDRGPHTSKVLDWLVDLQVVRRQASSSHPSLRGRGSSTCVPSARCPRAAGRRR